jgi:WD40 repeat protein
MEPLPEKFHGSLGDLWGRHWGVVRCAAFHPDGTLAASGGNDKLIRLWDTEKLEPRGILKGPGYPIHVLAFSPDGKKLASCCDDPLDPRVWLWDREKQDSLPMVGHGNVVTTLTFSKNGKWLLSCGQDQVVIRWDVKERDKAGRLALGTLAPGVWCVALSPDGRHVLSGHKDKTLRLWDVETGKEVRQFKGHTEVVDSVAFSPDGSRAVSGSLGDRGVRLWNVEEGKEGVELAKWDVAGNLRGLAFTPRGDRVVANADGTTYLLDSKTLEVRNSSNPPPALALSPDSHHALGLAGDNILRMWDLTTNVQVRYPSGHVQAVTSVAFAPEGNHLLSGSSDRTATWWDLKDGTSGGSLPHPNPVSSIAVSPNGQYALIGSPHPGGGMPSLKLWEFEGRQAVGSWLPDWDVTSVAFSPDGRFALAGGVGEPSLRLWDVKNKAETQEAFGKVGEGINCVAFLPDGRAVSGGQQGVIRLWEVSAEKGKAKPTQPLPEKPGTGHIGPITSVACAPDGRYVLSGGQDETVRLWDLKEKAPAGRLLKDGPRSSITCVTFARDGKRLAASGADGRIAVWDLENTEKPFYSAQLPGAVYGLAFGGSRYLATANASGTVYIVDLDGPSNATK